MNRSTTSFSMTISEHWKKAIFLSFGILLLFLGNSLAEAETNCGDKRIWWQIGPDSSTPFIDLCTVSANVTDIVNDFEIFEISDGGWLSASGSTVYWPGNCSSPLQSHITQKNCGNGVFNENCGNVYIRTRPLAGKDSGGGYASAGFQFRYDDGWVDNVSIGPFGYDFEGCAPQLHCNSSTQQCDAAGTGDLCTSTADCVPSCHSVDGDNWADMCQIGGSLGTPCPSGNPLTDCPQQPLQCNASNQCMPGGGGIPCTSSAECATKCNASNQCVQGGTGIACTTSAQCATKCNAQNQCVQGGTGIACTSSAQCATKCNAQNQCVQGGTGINCSVSADCQPKCNLSNQCVQGGTGMNCLSTEDCRPKCNASNQCVQGGTGMNCLSTEDCRPKCNSSNQCVQGGTGMNCNTTSECALRCNSSNQCVQGGAGIPCAVANDCRPRCNAQNQCAQGGTQDLCSSVSDCIPKCHDSDSDGWADMCQRGGNLGQSCPTGNYVTDCSQAPLQCNAQNQCVGNGGGMSCATASDCTPKCNAANQCVQGGTGIACSTAADCTTKCNAANQCVQGGTGIACATAADCTTKCNAANQCVQGGTGIACTSSAQCATKCNAANQCVQGGTGIACTSNAQCATRCNASNQCVQGGTGSLCSSSSDCIPKCHDSDGDNWADMCQLGGNLNQSCPTGNYLTDCGQAPLQCNTQNQCVANGGGISCATSNDCTTRCNTSNQCVQGGTLGPCATNTDCQPLGCNSAQQCVNGGTLGSCTTNTDCQAFGCNSAQQCVHGGTLGPCTTNTDCLPLKCNTTYQCVHGGTGASCTTNTDCLPLGCNTQQQCIHGGTLGSCTTNTDCLPFGCNAQQQCVHGGTGIQCTTNTDCLPLGCNAQQQCVHGGTLGPCMTNTDCQPLKCNDFNQCIHGGTGMSCSQNTDCRGGCNTFNQCVPGATGEFCNNNADCSGGCNDFYQCVPGGSGASCTTNANCRGGCNTFNQCVPGGAGAICDDNTDCRGGCSTFNQCVPGASGLLCDDNTDCRGACNPQNQCVPGYPGSELCSNDNDCQPQETRCGALNQCIVGGTGVACTVNADCDGGCNSFNQCVPGGTGASCSQNSDCRGGCSAYHQCIPGGTGALCSNDSQCNGGCNAFNQCIPGGTGEPCVNNNDCAGGCNAIRQCVPGGSGAACSSDAQCAGGCNLSGQCVPGGTGFACTTNADCRNGCNAYNQCVPGGPGIACTNDASCQTRCNTFNQCAQGGTGLPCVTNADCRGGCNTQHQCVPGFPGAVCTTNADCLTPLACTLTAQPNPVVQGGLISLLWDVTGDGIVGGAITSVPTVNIPGLNDFTQDGSRSGVGPITAQTIFTLNIWDDLKARTAQCYATVNVNTLDISITKEITIPPSRQITVNERVYYRLHYQNNSLQEEALSVRINDIATPGVPPGQLRAWQMEAPYHLGCVPTTNGITCNIGTLPPGASGDIYYSAQGNALGLVNNTACISTISPDANPANNCDSETVEIVNAPCASLSIEKTITSIPNTSVGQRISYRLDYANLSTITQAVNVRIQDRVPLPYIGNYIFNPPANTFCSPAPAGEYGFNCTLGILAPGQAGVITYTAEALMVTPPAGITNTATLLSSCASDADTATAYITEEPVLAFTVDKTVTPETSPLTDGGDAVYRVIVTNTGNVDLANARITDILGAGTSGGSLALFSPATITCTSGVNCTGDIPTGFNCTNFIRGASCTINYTRVADTDTIPVGGTSSFTNQACVHQVPSTGTPIACDSATVILAGEISGPDLAVTMNVDDVCVPPTVIGPPRVPSLVRYDLLWENLGNVDMAQTTIRVDCDNAAINILSASGASTIDHVNNVITWTLGTVDAGGAGPVFFEAEIKDGYGTPTPVNFLCTAHIASAVTPINLEINQTNNDDDASVQVSEQCRESMSKRVTNLMTGITSTTVQAQPNDELEYTLSYTAGDSPVTAHIFQDNVGDILQYSELMRNPDGTIFGGGRMQGNTMIWDNGGAGYTIPPYQTVEVKFRVRVFDDDVLANLGGDFRLVNVYGNVVTVVTIPGLIKEKYVSVNGGAQVTEARAAPGDILEYTLRVRNISPDVSRNAFIIEDNITDILEYSDIIDAGGGTVQTNGAGQQIISWIPVDILPLGTVNRTFRVRIDDPLIAGGDFTLRNVYGNAVTVVTLVDVEIGKSVLNVNTGQSGTNVDADENHVLTYTLTAREIGGVNPFQNFIFEDDLTDILQYATITAPPCPITAGVMTCAPRVIPAGQTISLTFTANIRPRSQWPVGEGYDLEMTNVFGNVVTVNLPGVTEVDDHIEKTVSAALANPGDTLTYTITYYNEGDNPATGVIVYDDYDESRLSAPAGLPAYCLYLDLQDPLQVTGGPMGIRCAVGNLPANSTARSFTYSATVLTTATGDIINTASINQNEVDTDLTDNEASAFVAIDAGGLRITKTVITPATGSLQNGPVTYSILVENLSRSEQTFTVNDVFRTNPNPGSISGCVGGSAVFTPASSGIFSGTYPQFHIAGLDPNARVQITYSCTASNQGIDFNQSSQFVNDATIPETGATDSAEVFVIGPSRGGGGGGGGGSRIIRGEIILRIEKQAKDLDGEWKDADTIDLAALIGEKKTQDVQYRILVTNEGRFKGENLQVEDVFVSGTLIRNEIKSVNDAMWDPQTQTFTVETIKSGQTHTISYTAVLEARDDPEEGLIGVNEATITNIEAPSDLRKNFIVQSIEGIGEEDPAYVKTEGVVNFIDAILKKRVSKAYAMPGEELEYVLTLRNLGEDDFTNIVITDTFPYQYLDILSMDVSGARSGNTISFQKRILRPDELWIIRISARVKANVAAGTMVDNVIVVDAENHDLSDREARTRTQITAAPRPDVHVSTGGSTNALIALLFSLVSASLIFFRSRVRRSRI